MLIIYFHNIKISLKPVDFYLQTLQIRLKSVKLNLNKIKKWYGIFSEIAWKVMKSQGILKFKICGHPVT